jgi:hypothetical protein
MNICTYAYLFINTMYIGPGSPVRGRALNRTSDTGTEQGRFKAISPGRISTARFGDKEPGMYKYIYI